MADGEFGLKKSFNIDNGELDGKTPQECFVLGYEMALIDERLSKGTRITGQLIHADNLERIRRSCNDSGRVFRTEWMQGDSSESWMILDVP